MQPYTFRANGNHAKWTNTTNEMVIRHPRNWVANYGRETICRDNLKEMTDKPYFTDGSTIDGFMAIAMTKNPSQQTKTICMRSELMVKLQKEKYTNLDRWFRNKEYRKNSIYDWSQILIPCNIGAHWILIQVKTDEKLIRIMDPMHSKQLGEYAKYINRYLENEHIRLKRPGEMKPFKVKYSLNHPMQMDSYSCGRYVISYMMSILSNTKYSVTHENVNLFTKFIINEIVENFEMSK